MKVQNRSPHKSITHKSILFTGMLLVTGVSTSGTPGAIGMKAGYQTPNAEVPAGQTPVIAYRLTPLIAANPRQLQVTMHFSVPAGETHAALQMPAWSPGDYHLQYHARYVRNFHARDSANTQHELDVTQPDPNTWDINTGSAHDVTVTYTLQETPPGFFSENVQLRSSQIFLNGTAVYMYLVGHKEMLVTLQIDLPNRWLSETPLPMQKAVGGAAYTAPDYDTLADSPVVIAAQGAVTTREFTLGKTAFRAVYFGQQDKIRDVDAYTPVLKKIAQAEIGIFGTMPTERYDFLFDVDGRGGGLEHLNCCRIALPSGAVPERYAPFIAHEFFHLWNVKRIRPQVLGPFDYIEPPRTRNLWFAEGVTEYYAHIATRRAGLTSASAFLTHWRRAIAAMQQNLARFKVTADQSSLKVWESGDSQGFGGLSYYDKGELIGLCLDLKIRAVTDNRRSLDDVMRLLWQRTAPPKPGYGEDDIRAAVNKIAGADLSAFYDSLARSSDELPYSECLAYAGLDDNLRLLPTISAGQQTLYTLWSTASAAAPKR